MEGLIWPHGHYFENPDPSIVDAMKQRTDSLEAMLDISNLEEAISGSGRRYIEYSTVIDHPEFKFAEVKASEYGIGYRFYKETLEDGSISGGYCMSSNIWLTFLNKTYAPEIVTEEYPYFTGMYYSEARDEDRFRSKSYSDIPENLSPLLSSLAKQMIIENLVEQGKDETELLERRRKFLNDFVAPIIVIENPDPIKAREELEKIGIYDDPKKFTEE